MCVYATSTCAIMHWHPCSPAASYWPACQSIPRLQYVIAYAFILAAVSSFFFICNYTSLLASLLRLWTLPLYLSLRCWSVYQIVLCLISSFGHVCYIATQESKKKSRPLHFWSRHPWNTTSKFRTFYTISD